MASQPATTLDKIDALIAALLEASPEDLGDDGGEIAELLQIAEGLGVDVVGFLRPKSAAEADVLVDKLICLLFELRGDDLPPFDPTRYGETDGPDPAPPA